MPLAVGLLTGRDEQACEGWLVGGWLVLVVAGWSFAESIDDGIEPTSGPRPETSSSGSASGCPTPMPTPTSTPMPTPPPGPERSLPADAGTEPDFVATAIVCKTSD
ncbi:hypothetical protein DN402_19120 [Streptomyces sp. SW4]|nr:hypothetical protein DN402_19120 [Streptomyces sp. SW4]